MVKRPAPVWRCSSTPKPGFETNMILESWNLGLILRQIWIWDGIAQEFPTTDGFSTANPSDRINSSSECGMMWSVAKLKPPEAFDRFRWPKLSPTWRVGVASLHQSSKQLGRNLQEIEKKLCPPYINVCACLLTSLQFQTS